VISPVSQHEAQAADAGCWAAFVHLGHQPPRLLNAGPLPATVISGPISERTAFQALVSRPGGVAKAYAIRIKGVQAKARQERVTCLARA